MEVRLHGRGGQGGVTCAKILAATWARLGMSVQAFGDYAGERSGAPVRAYLRVDSQPVTNRNKVYAPDHVLVLDHALLDAAAVAGLRAGGTLVVNTPEAPEAVARRFPGFHIATVDATAIARARGIGGRSVVIVNTTIAGAFARALDLPFAALEAALIDLHLAADVAAARDAWEAVRMCAAAGQPHAAAPPVGGAAVLDLVAHVEGATPAVRTGSWRSSTPRYVTRPAPCSVACPAGNDVVGFVQALSTDGVEAAAQVLARTTPFAAVCGRVCPGYCNFACNRATLDDTVDTRGLERWIGDHATVARGDAASNGRRAAVVGGGPAGISAAYQFARAGWHVDLFDAADRPGGLLRSGIPPWRLPRALLDREVDAVLDLGVTWHGGERVGPDVVAALSREMDAVVLATGQTRAVDLELSNTALNGIEQGLDYLRGANAGLASQERGHVVVIGGGNTAIDCARSALRRGAAKVTVVYRRTRDAMPAIVEEIEEAHEEGVQFRFLRGPIAAFGDDHIGGLELAVMEAGERGGRPVATDKRDFIECDAVLLALGQTAEPSAILPEGWVVRDGQVHVDGQALPVFAAGDFSTGEGTVTHAIGDGMKAAVRARSWFGEVQPEPQLQPQVVGPKDLRFDHFDRRHKAAVRKVEPERRVKTGEEVALGPVDASDAKACLSCGHCNHCDTCLVVCPEGVIHRAGGAYMIDPSQCKGCGLCVRECPRAGMEMSS